MATTTRIGTTFGERPVLSANGRYVAYVSTIVELTNDTNGASDVVVQDLLTGQIYFVSLSSSEVLGNLSSSFSDAPAISADGRFIAFESDATNLVPGDTNGENDLFLRDIVAGTTTRISLDSNGNQVPANTDFTFYRPSISADGRFVAFQSNAQLAGVPSSVTDIFVRDVVMGTTTIASVSSSGEQADSSSSSPSISADGRFVAFQSLAQNLVAGDTNIDFDIFVHDRLTQTTVCASVNSQGQKGRGVSPFESPAFESAATDPVMSPNGRYVVFQSSYTNLVPNDTNGVTDIFMRDLQTDTTTRISVNSNGNQANGNSAIGFAKSSISAGGRYVVFQSVANNLVSRDTNNALDVFVRDTVAGTTTRVSVNSNGEEPVAGFLGTESYGGTISADGSKIVFMSNGRNMNDAGIDAPEIYLRDFGTTDTVYRFYNTQTGVHFYTASAEERDTVDESYPQFNYEGESFRAAAVDSLIRTPVYRFYNTITQTHFYTISEEERDTVMDTYPQFNYEGEAYYAYDAEQPGTIELHRFYNTETQAHFYTPSAQERDTVIDTLEQFNYEGVGYYVNPL